MDLSFYKNKAVLVTGHTGFKGSWLCKILINAGADVTGYALEPPTKPSLYKICGLSQSMKSVIGDIRDLEKLNRVFEQTRPEIVIHMAAQPIVRYSYKNPVYTFDVNIMGTVNVLECVKNSDSVKSVINVTTDKVYLNKEWEWGYRENEEIKGQDPYSNSKSCSELITYSYNTSFFENRDIAISTVRAGNVIGGGDFADDRIIPDCIRAANEGKDILVRNPHSIRPYQHVLEPLAAYLLLAEKQYDKKTLAGNYNIGPDEADCRTTGDLVNLFCRQWNVMMDKHISWRNISDEGPHEAAFLKLDCSKIKKALNWKPCWNIEKAIFEIIDWNRENAVGKGEECIDSQIRKFLEQS